jgi:hypothetical protein
LKYIGPFLRINSLKKENVESQLVYLCKESVKHIVFKSRCGITIPLKELKVKNIPNFDINTFKSFSPLLCVYKKSSPKLTIDGEKLFWDEDSFKKQVIVSANAFMTLCLLELAGYYLGFKSIDEYKYSLGILYTSVAKKQLEFYTSFLRNEEGVFVDKNNISDELGNEIKFESSVKNFSFSDQAFIMAAFYKCHMLDESSDKSNIKSFSLDILNMFLQYKEELYSLSFKETMKLCLALNIFYDYSRNEDAKILLLDLMEYMMDNHHSSSAQSSDDKVEYECMTYISCALFYKNTGIMKFRDEAAAIMNKLINLHDKESGIFLKDLDKKETDFSCVEIMLYLLSLVLQSSLNEDVDESISYIIRDIFRHQVVDSSIILSWPETPGLDDRERYRNYSLKPDDILDEQFFRMSSISSPEISQYAPVFVKSVNYNKKKLLFTQGKTSFDSTRNFFIFFITLYLLLPKKP